MTMLTLLTKPNDDVGFVIDQTGEGIRSVQLVQVSRLPDSYLPEPDILHDDDLRPRWEQTPQSFIVDEKWDPKLIHHLAREYLKPYAFTYFLGLGEDMVAPAQR